MQFDAIEKALYTAAFILPGFFICNIVDAVNPPLKQTDVKYFTKCLLYSILNFAIWSWLYYLVLSKWNCGNALLLAALVLITFCTSLLSGILLAALKYNRVMYKLLAKLHLYAIDAMPTAWDGVFCNPESSYVIVTLNDDTVIYGWYSSQSYTSSDFEHPDMFLEKTYRIDPNKGWIENTENFGIYISPNNIKHIEFVKGEADVERSETEGTKK